MNQQSYLRDIELHHRYAKEDLAPSVVVKSIEKIYLKVVPS